MKKSSVKVNQEIKDFLTQGGKITRCPTADFSYQNCCAGADVLIDKGSFPSYFRPDEVSKIVS